MNKISPLLKHSVRVIAVISGLTIVGSLMANCAEVYPYARGALDAICVVKPMLPPANAFARDSGISD